MADPKGFEPLELVVEVPIYLLEAQEGLRFNRVPPPRGFQPTLG